MMMGWYTRSSRFIFDAFGRHCSKTSAFRSSSIIPQNLVYHDNVLKQQSSPFVDGGKRFYSGDRRRIKHPVISALTMAGCVVVGGVEIIQYFEKSRFKLETVPYTNRKQLLLFSRSQEQQVAGVTLKRIESKFKGRIMAPHDPMCIRAQRIGGDIVEVVKSQNAHLNEFEWEFVVVDDEPASVYPLHFLAGKIVVPSGLLIQFRGDDEVAAFIALAVGGAVARHSTEYYSNCYRQRHSLAIFRLILSPFYDSGEAKRLFMLPDRRKYYYFSNSNFFVSCSWMEMEADYIGLILMAAAGYDPRVAPRLWKQLGSKNPLDDFFSLHPCGKTRAQRLSQPGVMEEALSMYREARARRGIEAE